MEQRDGTPERGRHRRQDFGARRRKRMSPLNDDDFVSSSSAAKLAA